MLNCVYKMGDKKNVLIVYAHPEPKSFNGALKDAAVETLKAQGHDVMVSDLYAVGFDPVASKASFKEVNNPDYFNFQAELTHATLNNTLQDYLAEEMRKISAADLIILQGPMYWLGLPAILKGWLDKCFADKVAYDTTNFKWFDDGPLKDKKMMLSITCGGPPSFFTPTGIFGDIDVLLWPIHYTLRFTGSQILSPQLFYAPQDVTHDSRSDMLKDWTKRLETIWSEEPLQFVPVKHFDSNKGFELSEEYVESRKDEKCGPSIGQHMGKMIPEKKQSKS